MIAGRASWTAELVAAWRALADARTSVPGFHDPLAREMLGPAAARWLRRGEAALARMAPDGRDRMFAALSVITLRVATIDAQVRLAVAAGARQLVILGAGFDTRAHRMDELAPVRVFEVDHPATQRVKRTRAAPLPERAAELRYVPVDFARDALGEALAAAGHDPDAPTVWVWEGVVMYLRDEALRSTLAAVRGRSGPGSTLILHYHAPDPPGVISAARHALFWALGEAHVGLRSAATIRAELERAGLTVVEDTDAAEQAARLGAPFPVGPRERTSRVAVATVPDR